MQGVWRTRAYLVLFGMIAFMIFSFLSIIAGSAQAHVQSKHMMGEAGVETMQRVVTLMRQASKVRREGWGAGIIGC
jgi:hypothetical protein